MKFSEPIIIEICERSMDRTWDNKPKYHAQIKGMGGYWGCGITREDAIGALIMNHPEKFNIELKHLGKLGR